MPQTQLRAVLDQVISLTSERHSDALMLALAHALSTLSDVKNTTLYSAGNITRAKHALGNSQTENAVIPANIVDALFTCLTTAKSATVSLQANQRLTLFPLTSSEHYMPGVIVIEETVHPSSDASTHDLTMQILMIYNNFMSLMQENERDTLTGLLNRKTFDLKINDIIAGLQSPEQKQTDHELNAYLAIFDLDHFKRVNDTYGHSIGDEVLLLLSQQMHQNFRDQDLLFRFGGEEFVGIFQCVDDDTMMHILDRFRESIAAFNFPQVGQVTVSCGFTKINAFELSSKIIDRADVSLYHAKHHGRNQVFQHEQLVASGEIQEKETSSGDIELF